jgi:predicted metal-dependent HD superfamily phosphohydrolase
MQYKELAESTASFVTHIFQLPHRVAYPYHNLEHTKAVVEHANNIALFYNVSETDHCIIEIASWFHDTGQLYGNMEGHEHRSVLMMENYLSTIPMARDMILQVENCIMATQAGACPQTLPEKILCDADTWHFGTPFFRQTEFLVKTEIELRTGQVFPHWHQQSLQLLKNHVFYTEYCQLLLGPGKEKNKDWLKSLLQS